MNLRKYLKNQIEQGKTNWESRSALIRASGENSIDELNKETKFLYNNGEVDFATYESLSSEQKKKKRDKLRN